MASKYSQIPVGTIFKAKGANYKKIDDLYYEDISSGFQSTWNPMFDASIDASAPAKPAKPTDKEFSVDPQSRLVTRNANYEKKEEEHPAIKWMNEMWGSAEFDCGPEDYEWMAQTSIDAVKAIKQLGIPIDVDLEDAVFRIQDTLVNLEDKLRIANETIKGLKPKKAVKKPKTSTKKVVKK